MTRRECHEVIGPAVEQRAVADGECTGSHFHKSCECCLDVSLCARLYDKEFASDGLRRSLHSADLGLGMRNGWVNEKTDQNCLWHHLMQDLKPLYYHYAGQAGDAGDVAARPLDARD